MRYSRVLQLAAGTALAFGIQAAAQPVPPSPIILQVPTGAGRVEPFQIKFPGDATSMADRINGDLIGKGGAIPLPTPGYTITNRIIIRAVDAFAVQGAAQNAAITVARHPKLAGFWIGTAESVMDAILAAQQMGADNGLLEVYVDVERPRSSRTECDVTPADPGFPQQWNLVNGACPDHDLNVEPAWCDGYTGLGVIIGIVEAGWQTNHVDLAANYNATASSMGPFTVSSHATSVAGIAGMVAGNLRGGAGVAFNAELSNLLFGSPVSNADAFLHRNDLNDIKNNSWGPPDNGFLHHMTSIERAAIEAASSNGRFGNGEVFVWAAGNGGSDDRVEYDPYASSRFSIAVGAIGDDDIKAYYNEVGSSMFCVAHSSGATRNIYTTKTINSYTNAFGGTSATAPQASGVVALMLEANPSLTWRDVQHILVQSARLCGVGSPWQFNGAGVPISYDYGFGAIDAHAAVTTALSWSPVGIEVVSDSGVVGVNINLPDGSPSGATLVQTVTDDIVVESVELILNADTTYVGDLRIVLTSPQGTQSILAEPRIDPQDDLVDYVFTTHRNWNESSVGNWQIQVSDETAFDDATLIDYRLIVYGTNPPCVADFNGDGSVNTNDFIAYLNAFVIGNIEADLNGDGTINTSDFVLYLNLFNAGC